MPIICQTFGQDISKTFKRYAHALPKICPRYAENILGYAHGISKIRLRCAENMPKIYFRYAQDMFKMSKVCPR